MNSFTFFEDYYDLITLLEDEQEQAELTLSILKYMFEDIEPTLNSRQMKIFKNLKRPLMISKIKSKSKKDKIKTKSNENQNKIKAKSNEDESFEFVTKSMSMSNNNINNINNIKREEKIKKEEKKKFGEFVTMTNAEYEKLVSTHGEKFTKRCIETLDNYKGSSGKKYKSDYRAILSWVIEKLEKEIPKNSTPDWYGQDIEENPATEEEYEKFLKELGGI